MSISSERVKKWRRATKTRIVASMGGKCQCCEYNRCQDSLDLHHINPSDKEMGFGAIRANPKAWPTIVAELRKCVLVCRNCHGELHNGMRSLPEHYDTFDESYADYRVVSEDLGTPCPVCHKLKASHNKYCSLSCSSKARERVDWDNIPLLEMLKTRSRSSVAEELGISGVAVRKRELKLLKMVRSEGFEPPTLSV